MRVFFIKMHLYRFFLIVAFLFSFNFFAIADHHEGNIVIEEAIIVESEFDLFETYKEKDFSDIDPIEGFNRGLGNAIDNFFKTPQYFINNILQGKIGAAFGTVSRLVINSTVGLGGFIDVAGKMGIDKRPESFGDTLGVWGWKKSSYVQIPFKGPQTSRDVVGFIGDIFTDPLIFIGVPLWGNIVKSAGTAVDDRQESLGVLEEIEKTSLDFYSSIRSMYIQKRTDEIETDKITDYQSYLRK